MTFALDAVDDVLLDGMQSVTISVTHADYAGGSASLDVSDHETLTVSIDPLEISENGGAATGTVTRSNSDVSQPLTVELTSSDPGEAVVPATVEIPPGWNRGHSAEGPRSRRVYPGRLPRLRAIRTRVRSGTCTRVYIRICNLGGRAEESTRVDSRGQRPKRVVT